MLPALTAMLAALVKPTLGIRAVARLSGSATDPINPAPNLAAVDLKPVGPVAYISSRNISARFMSCSSCARSSDIGPSNCRLPMPYRFCASSGDSFSPRSGVRSRANAGVGFVTIVSSSDAPNTSPYVDLT